MTVTATIDAKPAIGVLNRIIQAAGNARAALASAAFSLEQRIALGFHQETDPWGAPWEPLSEVTVQRRRDGGRSGASILRDTGVMFGSLASSATDSALEISMSGPQVFAQQFGNWSNHFFNTPKGARAPIPARPFMPILSSGQASLPPDWMKDVVDALTAHLVPG